MVSPAYKAYWVSQDYFPFKKEKKKWRYNENYHWKIFINLSSLLTANSKDKSFRHVCKQTVFTEDTWSRSMDEYCLGTQPPTIPFKSTSSHCCLSLNSHVLTGLWTYVQSSPESGVLGCLFFFFFYNLHKNIGKCYGKCKFLIVLRKKNP